MKRWTAVLAALAAVAVLVWIAAGQMPDGRLHVYILDVASGQALLLQSPTGRAVVIDGGPEPSVLLTALGRRLPFWQRNLKAVVATHHGTSGLAALYDVCARYQVKTAITAPPSGRPGRLYEAWLALLAQRRTALLQASAGTTLETGDGVLVQVVAEAEGAIAVRIVYRDVDVLLPGATPPPGLPIQATIVAYPASAASPRRLAFGAAVRAVVLWNGARDSAQRDLPAWPGVQTYSTAEQGTLHIATDGYEIVVTAER